MLRPTNSSDNSSRGNSFYGDGTNSTWDPASFGYEDSRGEAARIIFYCATRYYNTCGTGGSSKGSSPLELSNNPSDATSLHTMGRLDCLIQWNSQYPVTDAEKRRNEYLYDNGYGRNPFIDNPDYANYIWTENDIRSESYTAGEYTPGQVDPENQNNYDIVTDLDTLTDDSLVSVIASDDDTNYVALTNDKKSDSLPWYIQSVSCPSPQDGVITTATTLPTYTLHKDDDGYYSLHCQNGYLYNYIDGTHYSLGIEEEPSKVTEGSRTTLWSLNETSEDIYSLKGHDIVKSDTDSTITNVYLNYQKSYGTFSGASSLPSATFQFYTLRA